VVSAADFADALSTVSLRLFLSKKDIEALVRGADEAPGGGVALDRFFEAAAHDLREKNQLPVLLMQKHHRSPDMHQSLNWSTDERFTEHEGKYELRQWLRNVGPFAGR
jgi:hypothetical protein